MNDKDTDTQELISVIIPVYNVEDYLEECISSVINQTYTDLEIILVDDGSTDKSPSICDAYKEKDSRVKVFHRDNFGVSASRNCGLLNCNGNYIIFVDSDDFLEKSALEKLYISLIAVRSDFCTCNNIRFYTDEKFISINPDQTIMTGEEFSRGMNTWRNQYCWGKLYTRKLITDEEGQIILFREDLCYSEDAEWMAKILVRTRLISWVSEPLYYYRKGRNGSATNDIVITFRDDYITSALLAYDYAISSFAMAHRNPPIDYSYKRLYFCVIAERTITDAKKPATHKYLRIFCREFTRTLKMSTNKGETKEAFKYAKRYMREHIRRLYKKCFVGKNNS